MTKTEIREIKDEGFPTSRIARIKNVKMFPDIGEATPQKGIFCGRGEVNC